MAEDEDALPEAVPPVVVAAPAATAPEVVDAPDMAAVAGETDDPDDAPELDAEPAPPPGAVGKLELRHEVEKPACMVSLLE